MHFFGYGIVKIFQEITIIFVIIMLKRTLLLSSIRSKILNFIKPSRVVSLLCYMHSLKIFWCSGYFKVKMDCVITLPFHWLYHSELQMRIKRKISYARNFHRWFIFIYIFLEHLHSNSTLNTYYYVATKIPSLQFSMARSKTIFHCFKR